MSSIRLFVLGSLDQHGPMHGRALLQLAEQEHIDDWTDFAPSAVYGAIKRLAAEGLIGEDRVEKQGNYPERQVYRISAEGQNALDELRIRGLSDIVIKPDPFDLALARLDPGALDELPGILSRRLRRLELTLASEEHHLEEIRKYLTLAENWSMSHKFSRYRAEIDYHKELLSALPEIISDERQRQSEKGHQQ
ncbi:MAG: PadR family transcriptional regulator [Actinomycetota bacterium]